MRRSYTFKTLGLGAAFLALSSLAGIAYAASERYDSAKDNITKAIALLEAIDNPNQPQPEKIHRQHAVRELRGALEQIDKAKAAADKPAPSKDKKDKKDWKGKKDDQRKDWKGKKEHKH